MQNISAFSIFDNSNKYPTLTVTSVDKISYSVFKDNEGIGSLNFEYYRTEVLGLDNDTKIDVLTMDCGINDLSGNLFSDSQLNTIITNVKKIVDAFTADNPNGKVVLCMPKSRNSDLRSTSRNMLRYNIFNFSKKAVEKFTDHPNVIISQSGFAMDRFYGYPIIDQKVANRYNETLLMANNDVHPRAEGYHQIADGMTGAVLIALK
ncbi:SGNH/GDSL hydrolase family protein [Dysgonomonas sp. Marseille-P4361]|uniref:SGNH/GDSL hydrolase family protein n=1 Tax=Dysgonomonas sp. Marseille-P4361 TaxID=2161820 RepID=UPI0013587537|nr:SGNH/GDSL hydrolase family protein [Dysgonomonas sp. Marseille-P4361]